MDSCNFGELMGAKNSETVMGITFAPGFNNCALARAMPSCNYVGVSAFLVSYKL